MESKDNSERIYLPGLNGLRFLAAFSVMLAHIELLKEQLGVVNWHPFFFRLNLGGIGVYFFFVLSGFLITYLLMIEKERKGKVNIRAFYVRRLLRIWPLYYFITLLGFFILPYFEWMHIPWLQQFFADNFSNNLWLFLLMLPNAALAFMPAVPHIGQLWSIGVEEQFYLIWPNLFARAKKVGRMIIVCIVIIIAIKAGWLMLLKTRWIESSPTTIGFTKFLAMSKFECMAIGAYGAFLVHHQKFNALRYLQYRWSWVTALVLLPLVSYFTPEALDDIVHLPYAVLFLIIIINVSVNHKALHLLENDVMNHLGNVSYGIYMYHMMIVAAAIQVGKMLYGEDGNILFNLFVYVVSITVTILVSTVSFRFFEQPFLKLKHKFTVVPSGR
jgi:peptidoglycan/LPS O-acetylase OafA/YrhL